MAPRIRCAIYTRKSSEEGLEQDFNSLDAQHEACAAFITSQKAEGWVLVQNRYDDGGISGGTLGRPGLQRLLEDIEAGLVDQIVVYKIDRLTRSLSDFAKIVDRLDAGGASFVSVTQSFNTATSMGRLTLNMLLSFAQFEREVTAERIRDKIAASKRKGLWMGGAVPFGYRADGRTLAIDETEAPPVRHLYELYLAMGSVRAVTERAAELGYRSRFREFKTGRTSGGTPFTKGHIWHILTNPLYAGRIRHREKVYDGQHPGIIAPDRWQQVQAHLTTDAARDRGKKTVGSISPLIGKLFDETGDRLTPSHSQKNGRRLRYYVSRRLVMGVRTDHPDAWRLPGHHIEAAIGCILRDHLMKPAAVTTLVERLNASEIPGLQARIQKIANDCSPGSDVTLWASLLRRADLCQGSIAIRMDRKTLADRLGIAPDRIISQGRRILAPFRTQRRGVETKIIIGLAAATPSPDAVLIRNVLAAHGWYDAIRKGATVGDVAKREKVTTSRIQHMIGLAFLAPEIVGQIAAGTQPIGFTSDWFKRHQLPQDWLKQREILAAL